MNQMAFTRVPRLGAPFGGGFDFAAAPRLASRMGQDPSPSPSPSPSPAPAVPGIEILPPSMQPFYNYPVVLPTEPAVPVPVPTPGISTTTALIIGAATLVGVAAIVAFASKG